MPRPFQRLLDPRLFKALQSAHPRLFRDPVSSHLDHLRAQKDSQDRYSTSNGIADGISKPFSTGPGLFAQDRAIEVYNPITTDGQDVIFDRMVSGRDLMMSAPTGSGKTFGLVVALLQRILQGQIVQNHNSRQNEKRKHSRAKGALILVPYFTLASQIYRWISNLAEELEERQSVPPIKKALFGFERERNNITRWLSADGRLPDITVATPSTFVTALGLDTERTSDLSSRFIGHIDLLLLDEADALLNLPGRYKSPDIDIVFSPGPKTLASGKIRKRRLTKWEQHPPEGFLVLASLLGVPTPSESTENGAKKQVVVTGATINTVLRSFLIYRTRWLHKDAWVGDLGEKIERPETEGGSRQAPLRQAQVDHTAIIIGDDHVRNIRLSAHTEQEKGVRSSHDKSSSSHLSRELKKPDGTLSREVMESLAVLLNLEAGEEMGDVIIFVHPEVSLGTLRDELASSFGINTELLMTDQRQQMSRAAAGSLLQRRVFLAKESQARGLDFPTLTHVLILSSPTTGAPMPSSDLSYQHMAGRIGRLGSRTQLAGGKVILIAQEDDGRADRRIEQMWTRLHLRPIPSPHIEAD